MSGGSTGQGASVNGNQSAAGYVPITSGGSSGGTQVSKGVSGTSSDPNNGYLDLSNPNNASYQFDVWTGDYTVPNAAHHLQQGREADQPTEVGQAVPQAVNAGQYMQQLASQTPGQIELLQSQLVAAGELTKNSYVPGTFDAATQDAMYKVMRDSSIADAQGVHTTVMGLLTAEIGRQAAAGKGTTTTQSDIHYTDPEAAKKLLTQALGQYLGVLPSDAQVASFTAALQAQEKANPQLTQTNVAPGTQIDPATGMPLIKSQVAQEGMGTDPYRTAQTQYAEDWARSQPGAAEYQAATSYYQALWQAITSPGGVSGG